MTPSWPPRPIWARTRIPSTPAGRTGRLAARRPIRSAVPVCRKRRSRHDVRVARRAARLPPDKSPSIFCPRDRGRLSVRRRASSNRGFLQPEAPAFDPRLQVASSVPGKLDQRAASGKTGRMKSTLWQTKHRGNLTKNRSKPVPDNRHFAPVAKTAPTQHLHNFLLMWYFNLQQDYKSDKTQSKRLGETPKSPGR